MILVPVLPVEFSSLAEVVLPLVEPGYAQSIFGRNVGTQHLLKERQRERFYALRRNAKKGQPYKHKRASRVGARARLQTIEKQASKPDAVRCAKIGVSLSEDCVFATEKTPSFASGVLAYEQALHLNARGQRKATTNRQRQPTTTDKNNKRHLGEDIHLRVRLRQAEGIGGSLGHEQELDGALPVAGVLTVP